jgi:hypothetical protein
MRHPVCHLESEAEYFRRVDAELLENLRRRAAFEERRRRMAEACQTEDPRILSALEELGYDQTNARLLYLVPLVHVAWSDGSVNAAERNQILVLAALQGIQHDNPAYQQLLAWLDQKPRDEFLYGTLHAIQAIFRSLPEGQQSYRTEHLIRSCRQVAFASCGFFGWKSKICLAKQALIREMRKLLEPERQAAAAGVGS